MTRSRDILYQRCWPRKSTLHETRCSIRYRPSGFRQFGTKTPRQAEENLETEESLLIHLLAVQQKASFRGGAFLLSAGASGRQSA